MKVSLYREKKRKSEEREWEREREEKKTRASRDLDERAFFLCTTKARSSPAHPQRKRERERKQLERHKRAFLPTPN